MVPTITFSITVLLTSSGNEEARSPAHPHRCFELFWPITPQLRLMMGGAMLANTVTKLGEKRGVTAA